MSSFGNSASLAFRHSLLMSDRATAVPPIDASIWGRRWADSGEKVAAGCQILPRTLAPCSCIMSTGRHLLFGNNERIGSSAYWLRRPRLVENITAKDCAGNVALFLLSFVVVCLLRGFKTLETLKRVLLKVLATSGRGPHFGRRNRHTAEYNRARTERWIRRVR
jgi:hypothetical protein